MMTRGRKRLREDIGNVVFSWHEVGLHLALAHRLPDPMVGNIDMLRPIADFVRVVDHPDSAGAVDAEYRGRRTRRRKKAKFYKELAQPDDFAPAVYAGVVFSFAR